MDLHAALGLWAPLQGGGGYKACTASRTLHSAANCQLRDINHSFSVTMRPPKPRRRPTWPGQSQPNWGSGLQGTSTPGRGRTGTQPPVPPRLHGCSVLFCVIVASARANVAFLSCALKSKSRFVTMRPPEGGQACPMRAINQSINHDLLQ